MHASTSQDADVDTVDDEDGDEDNEKNPKSNSKSVTVLYGTIFFLVLLCLVLFGLLAVLYVKNQRLLADSAEQNTRLLGSDSPFEPQRDSTALLDHNLTASATPLSTTGKPATTTQSTTTPDMSFSMSIGQLLSNRAASMQSSLPSGVSITGNNKQFLRLSTNIQPEHFDVVLKPFLPPPGTSFSQKRASAASTESVNFRLEGVVTIYFHVVENATQEIHLHSEGLRIDTEHARLTNETHTIALTSVELMTEFDLLMIKTADVLYPCNNSTTRNCTFRLIIPYVGKLSSNQELVGFYYGTYHHQPLSFDTLDFNANHNGNVSDIESDANTRHLFAVTKLEPVYARRMMPCFDEPALKSTYTLSIYTLHDVYHVRSSMHVNKVHVVGKDSPPRADDQGAAGRARRRASTPQQLLPEHEQIWPTNLNISQHARQRASAAWLQHARWTVYEFHKSPIMPVYTLAILISSFDSLERLAYDGTPIAVWAPRDRVKYGAYALQAIDTCLWSYNNYFGISYRDLGIPKIDFVAVPQFQPGAMENWGLVTHHEQLLLFRYGVDTVKKQYHISGVICHELVHQWFGNLVTLAWWGETWLNEAFATFFEYYGLEHFMPDWRRWQLFAWENIVRVLDSEDNNPGTYAVVAAASSMGDQSAASGGASRSSSYPFGSMSNRYPLYNPGMVTKREAVDSFQESTNPYKRGASILLMMRTAIGEENFLKMLKQYVYDFRWKVVSTPDLASYFDKFCTDISCPAFRVRVQPSTMMRSWTDSIGYPLLNFTVATNAENDSVWTISQQRYIRKRTQAVSLFESLRYGSRFSAKTPAPPATTPSTIATTTTTTASAGNWADVNNASTSAANSLSETNPRGITPISTTDVPPPETQTTLLQYLRQAAREVSFAISKRTQTTPVSLSSVLDGSTNIAEVAKQPGQTNAPINSSPNIGSLLAMAASKLAIDKRSKENAEIVEVSKSFSGGLPPVTRKPLVSVAETPSSEPLYIMPLRVMKAHVMGRTPAVVETLWITNASMQLPSHLIPREDGEYIVADIDYGTITRVDYPPNNWRTIGRQLQHNPLRLPGNARTKILVDAYAFIKHEQMPIDLFVDIYRYLAKETHVPVLLAGWQNVHAFLGMYKMSSILTSLTGNLISSAERTLRDDADDASDSTEDARESSKTEPEMSSNSSSSSKSTTKTAPILSGLFNKTAAKPPKRSESSGSSDGDDVFIYRAKTQIPREYGEFRYQMLEAAHSLFKRFGNKWHDVVQPGDSPLWRIIAQHISLDTICFFDAPQCAMSVDRLHSYIAQRRSYPSWLCQQQFRRDMLGTDLAERLLCAAVANGGLTEWLYTYDELQRMIQYQTNTTQLWHDEQTTLMDLSRSGMMTIENSTTPMTNCRAIVTEQEMYAFKSALEMCTPRSSSAKLGMVSVFG